MGILLLGVLNTETAAQAGTPIPSFVQRQFRASCQHLAGILLILGKSAERIDAERNQVIHIPGVDVCTQVQGRLCEIIRDQFGGIDEFTAQSGVGDLRDTVAIITFVRIR